MTDQFDELPDIAREMLDRVTVYPFTVTKGWLERNGVPLPGTSDESAPPEWVRNLIAGVPVARLRSRVETLVDVRVLWEARSRHNSEQLPDWLRRACTGLFYLGVTDWAGYWVVRHHLEDLDDFGWSRADMDLARAAREVLDRFAKGNPSSVVDIEALLALVDPAEEA